MQRYLLSRLGETALVVVGMAVVVFFMVRLTGDPAAIMMPRDATKAEIAEFRHAMGLDRPTGVQFVEFIGRAAVGNLGKSLYFRDSVSSLILQRLPATLELAFAGLILAAVVGIPLGMASAHWRHGWVDALARLVGLIGQAAPGYWVAMALILLFAVRWHLLPAVGRFGIKSLVLPAITVSLPTLSYLTRLTRTMMLETLTSDYIRTARAKGIKESTIYWRHALKNVAIPLVTVVGVQFGYLVGGSVFVETVFAWPGLGRLAYQAISVRDFPLVQGIALFTGCFVSLTNLVVDVLYVILNPRIRYS